MFEDEIKAEQTVTIDLLHQEDSLIEYDQDKNKGEFSKEQNKK